MRREHPRARGKSSFLPAALVFVACSSFLFFASGLTTSLARESHREDALKAGYLFNFMKFVEWPSQVTAEPFTICFLGDSGVHDELAHVLPDKRAASHGLAARRLAQGEAFTDCQALYIDANEFRPGATPFTAPIPAILTVSDADNFLRGGGVIELFAEGNRLRFRISLDNARRAHLRISSSLLQLASEVEKES